MLSKSTVANYPENIRPSFPTENVYVLPAIKLRRINLRHFRDKRE